MKELYTYKCPDCKKTFRTEDPKQRVCSECQKYRQPHHTYGGKKAKPKVLTFADISHITNVYYKIHGKYLHYGDIVNLIDSNPKKCICCGATVTKNKHICAKCEKI
jgi:hypothetical protein